MHGKHRLFHGFANPEQLYISLWEVTSIGAAAKVSFHTQGGTSAKKPTPFEGQADAQRSTKKGSLSLLVTLQMHGFAKVLFWHLLGHEYFCWSVGNMHYAGSAATVTLAEHWVTCSSIWIQMVQLTMLKAERPIIIAFLILDPWTDG